MCLYELKNHCVFFAKTFKDEMLFERLTWPVTWVPEYTPKFKFSVKILGDKGDGVAKLTLASDTIPSAPYVEIHLGWNAGRNGEISISCSKCPF